MTRHETTGQKPRGGTGPRRDGAAKRASPGPRAAKRTAPAQAPAEDADDKSERQRIAKLMARVGLCSRRDAETWILEGRVSVNGTVLTSPALDVGPEDVVLVDGAPLPAADKTRLFLFHKPRGLITSDHDPEGRATVFDYLRDHWPDSPRVVTVGRLDINTEGLLLLTNDGGLARVLELPQTGWVRRYRVRAKGETDQAVLDGLADGVTIDGIDYAGIEAKLDRIQGANCWLTMGLREGKNREVKRVLEHIGLEVNRLIRLSFGPFQLLDLPEGHVEEIKTRILRDQLGPALAAQAGVDFTEAEPVAPIVAAPLAMPKRGARDDRAARPVRKPEAATAPRGRNFRDRDRSDEVVPPEKRERPIAGPRKHVSTLRAQTGAAIQSGPRKRLERTDTTDHKNRTVTVERLVSSAPAAEERRGRPARRERPEPAQRRERSEPASRRERSEPAQRRERSEPVQRRERSEPAQRRERSEPAQRRERSEPAQRRERSEPAQRRERSEPALRRERPAASPAASRPFAKEGRISQSALGKRERVARSGGAARSDRVAEDRPSRSDDRGGRPFRRDASADRSDSRPPRRESSEAPRGRSEGGKPFAGKSGRPATGRAGDKPQRSRPAGPRAEGKSFGAKGFAGRMAAAKSFGERPARSRSDAADKPRGRPDRTEGKRGAPAKGARPPREGKPGGGTRPPRPRS